jgi:hypothetical protein
MGHKNTVTDDALMPDGSLQSTLMDWFVDWSPGEKSATLDGYFSSRQLRDIADVMDGRKLRDAADTKDD